MALWKSAVYNARWIVIVRVTHLLLSVMNVLPVTRTHRRAQTHCDIPGSLWLGRCRGQMWGRWELSHSWPWHKVYMYVYAKQSISSNALVFGMGRGTGGEIVWPVTATATAMVIHPHHCCGGHRGSAGLFSSVSPSLYDYVTWGGGGGPSEWSRLWQTGDCSFSLTGLFYCKVAHNPPNRLTQDDATTVAWLHDNSHLPVIFIVLVTF